MPRSNASYCEPALRHYCPKVTGVRSQQYPLIIECEKESVNSTQMATEPDDKSVNFSQSMCDQLGHYDHLAHTV